MTSTAPHPPASVVAAPPDGDTWVALTHEPLPVAVAAGWAVKPDCGALVVFSGSARDHAPSRPGVTLLEYEAYEAYVEPAFADIAHQARQRAAQDGRSLGRIAIWHRTGRVEVGESAVVVAVSAPHRPEAFDAARFCIDEVKASAPLWKREEWAGGSSWGVGDGA